MIVLSYKTVRMAATAEYEEKRSRFIGSVIPCTTEKEALDHIAKVKSENFGARHNVYAYILRENNIARFSDDGEPHSTAGMPTLEVLRKQGLCDCCIVTTRYFGGVLLGTGGLVRAYTAAARMAVEAAGIAVMRECHRCEVSCPYSDLSQVERVINDCDGKLEGNEFTHEVLVKFSITADDFQRCCDKFKEVFCGRFEPRITGSGYAEV